MARGLTVSYSGNNTDIVEVQSGSSSVLRDLTLDQLHDYRIATNGSVVAVRCGRKSNGDGILLYGLSWQPDAETGNEKPSCQGVVRFVPIDHTLILTEVVSAGNDDAYIKVITGLHSDVYTQFYWNAAERSWKVFTQWLKGWGDPAIDVAFGHTIPTIPGTPPNYYQASYMALR
jgi:hypothetical protein